MLVIKLFEFLLSLYTLVLLVNFLVPLCTNVQKPWMVTLAKVSEPAVKLGRNMAAKVLPAREYNVDMGALLGCGLCFLVSMMLGWLF